MTKGGWEIEADERQDDTIIENMILKEAKRVSSPCEEERRWEDDENRTVFGCQGMRTALRGSSACCVLSTGPK